MTDPEREESHDFRRMEDVKTRDDAGPGRTDKTSSATIETDGSGDYRRLDRMFDALSHLYRRRVLLPLSNYSPRDKADLPIDELVTEDDDLEQLTVALYHTHLPKLAKAGYIDWDKDTGTIRRGPHFEEASQYLSQVYDHEDEEEDTSRIEVSEPCK
ncbi:DUF7344 domain-containing protein [Halegenticoccus tardaugens]|uniref:DUF7344 domain-containing protein n=1 Tax=Halegenticoccus tardaugens TaxID=2071624 RepID=UPI00100C3176|nr:hypothetical protein [Halegenticoccus tardaugens]